jgi:hypothetical protein
VSDVDILTRIDNVTVGLCQCGAEPREGSAYCGPDCEPTHVGVDTDAPDSGTPTQMRWRPDLVSAADDSDLIPLLGTRNGYAGRYNAQVFERADRAETWHLRLDDGHRFVGADLEGVGESIDDDLHRRVRETWATLERELGNTRHLVDDDDPWADVMPHLDAVQAVFDRTHPQLAEFAQRHQAAWSAAWESAFRAVQHATAGIGDHMPAVACAAFPAAARLGARDIIVMDEAVTFAPVVNRRLAAAIRAHAPHAHFHVYPDQMPTSTPSRHAVLAKVMNDRRTRSGGPDRERLDGRRGRRR